MDNKIDKLFFLKSIFGTILLILLLVHSFVGNAQNSPVFNIKFKLSVVDGDLKNAVITITKNGAPYRVIDPNGGKYTIDLDINAEYLITCTKMGYISKSVVVDTHIPKGREQNEFNKFSAEVELEKQPEDQEVKYSQPVGRIKFDGSEDDFDFDKDYTAIATEMQKKAKANPIPKPKPPTPNPRPTTEVKPPPPTPPSNPIPVKVTPPVYKPEPPKPKPVVIEPDKPQKPIVKNKTEKIIQEDRRKLTIITVNINGVDYVYKKEEYNWGGLFFYKDGTVISERTFSKETE